VRIALYPKTTREWRMAGLRVGVAALVVLSVPLAAGWYFSCMPGSSFKGPLAPLTPEQERLRDLLRTHVSALAQGIGERNMQKPESLEKSARYVEAALEGLELEPARHTYLVDGVAVSNIEAELPGTGLKDEIVVIGAHYDSFWETPGADDNASGVAVLLVLADMLRDQGLERTVRLVAFVNEEPPHFKNESMGSLRYARRCAERNEDVVAMMALEMLGVYVEKSGVQKYPPLLQYAYPASGDFVGFVGDFRSGGLVRDAVGVFRETTDFPSEGLVGPAWINGVDFSDHWSFWQAGYRAMMVTDTAFFRNILYHTVSDTPDSLDYDRMARVAAGLARVVVALANE